MGGFVVGLLLMGGAVATLLVPIGEAQHAATVQYSPQIEGSCNADWQ